MLEKQIVPVIVSIIVMMNLVLHLKFVQTLQPVRFLLVVMELQLKIKISVEMPSKVSFSLEFFSTLLSRLKQILNATHIALDFTGYYN